MTDAASENQNQAARPDRSTWLSANAGSGKTRVLTDRVARLLLHGAEPQNILCLTYTKAAASEMQNRLFRTLGNWAMLDDDKLEDALAALGEPPGADLALARTLFARAVETPGGLKIQTIHSLCASILRQFPLEAGLSPQFRELDEAGQADLIAEVLDRMAGDGDPALIRASMLHPDSLSEMAKEVVRKADSFEARRSRDEIFVAMGVPPDRKDEDFVDLVLKPGDIPFLKSLVPLLRQGKTSDQSIAEALEALPETPSIYALEEVEKALMTRELRPRKRLVTDDVSALPAYAPLDPRFTALAGRVAEYRPARVALQAAELAVAVQDFAQSFLPAYAKAKSLKGVLDFDDLIRKTRGLLTAQSLQWVLYRLDSRIDHILVDEAQDTSPAQWQVISALAEEMTSGVQDRHRTLFVVGDKKQSIYSFQGADAESFDRYKSEFSRRLRGLQTRELTHSFRSSPAILKAVDAVFGGNEPTGVGPGVRHEAFHGGMPGRVDLWDVLPREKGDDELEWHSTDPRTAAVPPARTLAEKVAATIEALIGKETIPGKNDVPRLVQAGDIMVLVRRRSEIFDQIIAACKKRRLPIAGSDRLKIGSELAVRDLLALLAFLDMPDDDLSLAAALRSPLFGWNERDLFLLASGRGRKRLWQALRDRRAEFPETHAKLERLLARVDYSRPYELLDRILTREDGRRALVARLGAEAEEGIDELLRQALASEQDRVPSLTRFLSEARAADIEVKRQSDSTGGLIRVMTVHGAKGLESPIVILPDTKGGQARFRNDLMDGPGFPVVRVGSKDQAPAVEAADGARKRAEDEERDRLLYVAMTRAEKWLIVCGIEPGSGDAVKWYGKVEGGLGRLPGVETFDLPEVGKVTRFSHGDWPAAPEVAGGKEERAAQPIRFPDRVRAPAEKLRLHSPSDLGGAKVLGGGALDDAAAQRRGRQVHRLLEMLGESGEPEALAQRLLATGPDAAAPDEVPALLAEAQRAMAAHPALFAPGALAEVDVVAETVIGPVSGKIDRLVVEAGRVLAVDFKTNAIVPALPEETPEGILRQMGAYLEALERIYPGRPIEVAILWTLTGQLMPLPHGIVRGALQRTQHLDVSTTGA
jgi:ATP-dependent helicase/nuclease subunit A